MSSDVNDIVNLTAMEVIEAQNQNAAYPGSISRFAQVAYESPQVSILMDTYRSLEVMPLT